MSDAESKTVERSTEDRVAYEVEADDRVSGWQAKFIELKDDFEDVSDDFKEWWTERVSHLRELMGRLQKRTAELKDAGDDAWDDAKERLEETRAEVREAWDRLMSRKPHR